MLKRSYKHVGIVLNIPRRVSDPNSCNLIVIELLENLIDDNKFLYQHEKDCSPVEKICLLGVVAQKVQAEGQEHAQLHINCVEPSPRKTCVSLPY